MIGIDFAPHKIATATQEAFHRNSSVEFIETDIFTYDLGQERYNLISCFGNNISDFPLFDHAMMTKLVPKALKPGGRFVIQYHDGSHEYMRGNGVHNGICQESPEQMTFCFKEYVPEIGAFVQAANNLQNTNRQSWGVLSPSLN